MQAIYDAESIALLVRWHDRTAEKTGQNGPTLPVPPEEEVVSAPAAEPSADEPVRRRGGRAGSPAGRRRTDPFAQTDAPAAAASEFSDAVAIQIPSDVPIGARKPYFIFGDTQSPVDLWFFDLAKAEPLRFTGKGSADVTPNDAGGVTGVASYDQGEWSVIFKRARRPEAGAAFEPAAFMPIAFSVWDGFSRERGNRRGLSLWYSIYLEPENVPSPVGPMITTALVILGIELAIVGWVRRSRSRPRETLGGERTQQPAASV